MIRTGYGDAYTVTCIDAETKLAISYMTGGKRSLQLATKFMEDLRSRVKGKPQISVDGWPHWAEAIRRTFGHQGADVDPIVKEYATARDAFGDQRKYAPSRVKTVEKVVIYGKPDMSWITTTSVERFVSQSERNSVALPD